MAKNLIEKGFPVDTVDFLFWTPLHCTCFIGNQEMFVFFIVIV